MSDKRRMDGTTTVDPIVHFLHRLQAEGWCVKELSEMVEYGTTKKSGVRLPVEARVTITLIPVV